MSTPWQSAMMDRLYSTACARGGWSYRTGGTATSEPTALACLALHTQHTPLEQWSHGLQSLVQAQKKCGGVSSLHQSDTPFWTTGLAINAWITPANHTENRYSNNISRAIEWLLATKGLKVPFRPEILGHDTRLQGWSWVEGTHSWLEPTAYGVLGLRAVNKADHPRTREAVALMRDRMFPSGGWNYGNTRTLGRTLRPFPGTTGIVLTALAGENDNSSIEPSIQYLLNELQQLRSPMSLAWGVIGLTECGVRPREADTWLSESASSALARDANPLEDALLLLADSQVPPFGRDAALPRESQVNG